MLLMVFKRIQKWFWFLRFKFYIWRLERSWEKVRKGVGVAIVPSFRCMIESVQKQYIEMAENEIMNGTGEGKPVGVLDAKKLIERHEWKTSKK